MLQRFVRQSLGSVRAFSTAVPFPVAQLTSRDVDGSRKCRDLRAEGLVPGIVYGPDAEGNDEKLNITLTSRDFSKMLRTYGGSLENTIFDVHVDGETICKAVARDLQLDPVTDAPISLNFLRFKPGRKIKIPVEFFNYEGSPGLKRGGYINYLHRKIKCVCNTTHVPATLVIDVTGRQIGDRLRLSDFKIPEGIEPLLPEDAIVATIAGRRALRDAA